jgi:hypothetical protein
VTALISTKMSDHFLQSQSSPLQMLLAKSTAACRPRSSAIFGWDEFFTPKTRGEMSIEVIDNGRKYLLTLHLVKEKSMSIGLAVSRSIVEVHEDSCGQKIILISVRDSHSSCPGEECVRREAIESLPCFAYEEHVIYRLPMDCYDLVPNVVSATARRCDHIFERSKNASAVVFCSACFLTATAVCHRLATTGLLFWIHNFYSEAFKQLEGSYPHLGIEHIDVARDH